MCLGIPARVIQTDGSGLGKVDCLGTKVRVNFSLLLRTIAGGLRLLEPLTSELLPRIC